MSRHSLLALLLLMTLAAGPLYAQVAPPPVAPVPQAATAATPPAPPAVPVEYVFPTGAGLLLFHVALAKVTDFDAILVRLKDALAKADTATRKLQAANWLIYKSAEKPAVATDPVVYLFLFDPAIATASYDPLLLLAEVLPAEVQPLYERMKAAVVRVERMGLTKVR
ncbi:MAG: hypothetical protein O2917_08085 [Acidobacteria bacterium]|nr:hypothetical protein [Acidobacteriota bacterium]